MTLVRRISCIAISVIIFFCCGCSRVQHAGNLDRAEKLMFESPDSALSILSGIDPRMLSDQQKARLALLQIFIPVIYDMPVGTTPDDVEKTLTAFDGDCSVDEVRSLIVRSVIAGKQSDPVGRIEFLKDAEFLASRLDDRPDLAYIYFYLSNVFSNGFNGTVSEYYANRALRMFDDLKYRKQSIDAHMAIVRSLAVKRDYKTMLDSLLAMKADVMRYSTDSYKMYYLDDLARTLDENGRTLEAISIYRTIDDEYTDNSNTLAHWAYAYMHINCLDSARMIIDRAIALPHGNTDEYLCRNVQYMIMEKQGAGKPELNHIDSLRNIASTNIFSERKLEESSLALNRKYESATQSAWNELQTSRNRTYVLTAIAIVVIVLLVCGIVYYRKRNRLLMVEHENDMLRMQNLSNNLFEKEHMQNQVAEKVAALFRSRFSTIDHIASAYFECRETGQEQKRIFSEAKAVISNFSSAASVSELEQIVNTCNDNLMVHFNEDFPKLSQSQRRLALYLFCGLSLQSISIFQGTDLRNIYVYKSRLKSVIVKSGSPHKDTYLGYFV